MCSSDLLSSGGAGAPSWITPASANTVSTLVKRDSSGNFAAGTITAALTGAASLNVLKVGDTMSGNLTFSDAQKIIGGTLTTADLTLQTTTGVGAAGADMHFLVGNNGATEALTILNSGNVGLGTTSPGSKLDVTTTGLGVTQTTSSGLALVNTTAAAAGAQQISPAIRWSGLGWKTDATAASQAVDFRSYVVPVQGAANPTGYLSFGSSVNGAAYSDGQLVLTTAGRVGIGTANPAYPLQVSNSDSTVTPTSGSAQAYLLNSHASSGVGSLMFGAVNTTRRAVIGAGADGTNGGYLFMTTRQDSDALFYERLRITNTGNVGIGTTAPAVAKLQVAGDAAIRRGDKLLLDADDGTADTYLVRNTGATTVSWFVDGTEIATLKKQTEVR